MGRISLAALYAGAAGTFEPGEMANVRNCTWEAVRGILVRRPQTGAAPRNCGRGLGAPCFVVRLSRRGCQSFATVGRCGVKRSPEEERALLVRFPFNERKTAQAAAQMLRVAGGELDYIVLIKLLYLCDRRALVDRGLPITGDRMVAMPWGPVLSGVLDDINLGKRPISILDGTAWYEYIAEPEGYAVRVNKGATETDELSKYELRIIHETFEEFGAIPKWDLVGLTHDLPEYHDPDGSSFPISPEDILRAEGKSDDDIAAANDIADDFWFLAKGLRGIP